MHVATVAENTKTNVGEVIIVSHRHVYFSKGNTIHYSGQVDNFKNFVEDKSIQVGSNQYIRTKDNFTIPITINSELPHIALHPCSNQKWLAL